MHYTALYCVIKYMTLRRLKHVRHLIETQRNKLIMSR